MSRMTLVIPGLLGPPAVLVERLRWLGFALQDLKLEHLPRLLGHGVPLPDAYAELSLEGIVCKTMSLEPGPDGDWPVGAACYRADGGRGQAERWLRADPVHVKAGLAEVHVSLAGEMDIHVAEASQIAAELNEHFQGQPAALEALHPQRWYMDCSSHALTGTVPPSLAMAGLVDDLFPGGDAARRWRGWLNEAQMVLHASPVNRARLARGVLPINSLWLWGSGATITSNPSWQQLESDEGLAPALAGAAHTGGEHAARLRVVSSLYGLAMRQDVERWRQTLLELETSLFAVLTHELATGVHAGVDVHPGFGPAIRCDAGSLKRRWRRQRSLLSFIETEDQ